MSNPNTIVANGVRTIINQIYSVDTNTPVLRITAVNSEVIYATQYVTCNSP